MEAAKCGRARYIRRRGGRCRGLLVPSFGFAMSEGVVRSPVRAAWRECMADGHGTGSGALSGQ